MEMLTNRITAYLKFRHISLKKKKRYIILFYNATHGLKASHYKYKKINRLERSDEDKESNRERERR